MRKKLKNHTYEYNKTVNLNVLKLVKVFSFIFCFIFRAAKEGLEKSILERLFMLNSGNFVCHLNVQYRMNKSIMKWSSRKLYNTSLVAHKSAEKRLLS